MAQPNYGAAGKAARQSMPEFSRRVRETDDPVMVRTQRMLGDVKDALSLGQGAVYWGPCERAVREAADGATEPEFWSYNADFGIAELREALRDKLRRQNQLHGYNVAVTAGANQALASLMLTLLDPADSAVLFKPYYFNALMAVQMTGGSQSLLLGPSCPDTFHPDLGWLQQQLEGPSPPRLVYLVNPGNPTGVTLPHEQLDRVASLTAAAGAWLVLDNTYEAFTASGVEHYAPNAAHIIHVFSFSKGHGLMGWRCGYIAYPDHDGSDAFGSQLIKVQDTIPIHASVMSQRIALGSLAHGGSHTAQRIASLAANREAALEALSPLGALGAGVWGGDAIYFWARLPEGCEDDVAVVRWLAQKHGVVVVPGSGCGCPGHVRVAFGKPEPGAFGQAAERLREGLQQLADGGMAAVRAS